MYQRNMTYLTIGMAIVYISLGITLAFTNAGLRLVPENRGVIGSVFLAYGTFRLISGIQKIKRLRSEDEE